MMNLENALLDLLLIKMIFRKIYFKINLFVKLKELTNTLK
jgi:hypothetical protein